MKRFAAAAALTLLLTGCRVDGWRIDPSGVWGAWVTDSDPQRTRWVGVGCLPEAPCAEQGTWSSWRPLGPTR